VRIDIWSDVVCPWCYLGKRRFDAAVAGLPFADRLQVSWRAFQLDPSAPREPQSYRAVLARKYGAGAVASMTERLERLGADAGIEYRWDHMQRVNTFDAHRVVAWAAGARQGDLYERLFRAYFTDGDNVGDAETLARCAADVGLDADEAARVAADAEAFADVVRADQAEARGLEITGVPAFVIARRAHIPGAQEVDTIRAVLTRCWERFGDDVAETA
jgi:predicted DsbA family dithiol-disulfide isomerase